MIETIFFIGFSRVATNDGRPIMIATARCQTSIVLIVAVCASAVQTSLETELIWNLETRPVVFRHNVTLKCTATKDCCESGSWKWAGGRNNGSISYDEGSVNKSKYVAKRQEDGNILVIKDFDVYDANKPYTCIYGFEKYTANLTLDEYECRPSDKTWKASHNITDNVILIEIHFQEVYPDPICYLTLDAINIKYTVHSHLSGLCFQVNISANYTLNDTICGGQLKFMCDVGTATISVLDVEVGKKSCSDSEIIGSMDNLVEILVAIVITVVAVLVFVVIVVYWRKTERKVPNKPETSERNLMMS